jgi:hypothetical protein
MIKRTTIYLVLILVGAVLSDSVYGQDAKKQRKFNHFLELGLGLNYHAVRDLGTSPLTYTGFQPAFHLQYFFANQKFMGIVDENFYIGKLKTRNFSSKDDNKAHSYNNELSFSAFYNYRNYRNSSLFFGGELGTLVNIRLNDKFNNANLNYEFFVSLSPSLLYEYRSSWSAGKLNLGLFSVNKRDRSFKFQYGLTIPVFTTLLRPGFITISDFVNENNLMVEMENIKFVSFDRLFVIKNKFNFYYILHNNNMLKFNYVFNYYSYYQNLNPVKGFNSAFFVSIVFRFTNN